MLFALNKVLFVLKTIGKKKTLCKLVFRMKWRFFIIQEILGVLLGIALVVALMYPINSSISMLPEKKFGIMASIFLAVVTFRHAVSFGTFPSIPSRVIRFLWFAINIYLMIFVYYQYQTILLDLEGQSITVYLEDYSKFPDYSTEVELLDYIRKISTFSIVGTFLGIVITNFRLLKSLFKKRNTQQAKTLYEEHL